MIASKLRLSIVEYGEPVDLVSQIVTATGCDRTYANMLLVDAGKRIATRLGVASNPIESSGNGVRIVGAAGLIRLSPYIELEAVPKFLRPQKELSNWREDFFFLSTISRFGQLLESDRLSSSSGTPRDLPTLIARALILMYLERKRRPLRTYRRYKDVDFYIDGDVDPVNLLFPTPYGFEQEVIQFDRMNGWNGVISAAAKQLMSEVSDSSTIAGLGRIVQDLHPQHIPQVGRTKRLPSRHRNWSPLYELSRDVIRGQGLSYDPGQMQAPGYVLSTWQTWEALLSITAKLAFGATAVMIQKVFSLGTRSRAGSTASSPLVVYPDCFIVPSADGVALLMDAKYKTTLKNKVMRIGEADVYEALAFSRAAICSTVILAYPRTPLIDDSTAWLPGSCSVFERVQVGETMIIGLQVEVQGISKPGALRQFATRFKEGIEAAAATKS